MNLYTIAANLRELQETLAEHRLDEQTIADTLDSESGDFEQKLEQCAKVVRNLEALANARLEACTQMSYSAGTLKNNADKLKAYMMNCMELAGKKEYQCVEFGIKVKQNPPAVTIAAGAKFAPEYMTTPKMPEPTIDKAAIKLALQSGEVIEGATLTRGTRLEIK
jgi:hypothetical protein